MADKPIVYTRHAETVLHERRLDRAWIETTVREPDWIIDDSTTEGATRYFRSILEFEDRVLRVVCFETAQEIRILTAFFDRKARRPNESTSQL